MAENVAGCLTCHNIILVLQAALEDTPVGLANVDVSLDLVLFHLLLVGVLALMPPL